MLIVFLSAIWSYVNFLQMCVLSDKNDTGIMYRVITLDLLQERK